MTPKKEYEEIIKLLKEIKDQLEAIRNNTYKPRSPKNPSWDDIPD